MAIESLKKEFTFTEDKIESLKNIAPEVFADGKINWQTLREVLGDLVEDDSTEHFGLFWSGKREARRLATQPSKGTLVLSSGEGIEEDSTENIFIEGDNLEVLKILQKSYKSRIKMIYIDPPYNTGNDFIYRDDYSEPLESYLRKTNQQDEEGNLLTTNPKSDGRFHSNWLNMIYPRLRVARNLLQDDGLIFVSIGDAEIANLILVMNEIFGQENQVAIFTWKSRAKPTNAGDAKFRPQKVAEYILCYAKNNGESYKFNVVPTKERTYPHTDINGRGKYRTTTILTSNRGMFRRETMRFEIGGFFPDEEQRWKAGYTIIKDYFDDDRIGFNEDGIPYLKVFEQEESEALYPIYTFMDTDLTGTAEIGKSDLNELIGRNHGMDTVKPVNLLRYLIASSTNENDLILDFFAGSATTAQAVYELNSENNESRKFILVQLPESISKDSEAYKAGFNSITEICKARMRAVSQTLKEKTNHQTNAPSLLEQNETNNSVDLGFKVFNLSGSNFIKWQDYKGSDYREVRDLFTQFESPLVNDTKEQNIISEIILTEGFPLNSKQTIDERFERNKITRIDHEFYEYKLYICLDVEIYEDTVDQVAKLTKDDIFICLDSALTDEAKISLADVCRIKTF